LWQPENDLKSYFDKEGQANELEEYLNRIYFEVYEEFHRKTKEHGLMFQLPLIIVDGMSMREGAS